MEVLRPGWVRRLGVLLYAQHEQLPVTLEDAHELGHRQLRVRDEGMIILDPCEREEEVLARKTACAVAGRPWLPCAGERVTATWGSRGGIACAHRRRGDSVSGGDEGNGQGG